ncbi:hypothetical protein [Rhizobium leguminosarum]|uniref:hypothetical protein n=1 Tax=Rhizobium leguminosarum TaxID=384 RepID=UPI0014420E2B|nr:hypothetical protein [Rhizobium leguminosarum]MBY5873760.1 hypothetical protein [Rhizobium leguminosarum]NKL63332.1 hypothetical protein [Rhizobium leguminosarum bv. viciae]
MATERVQIGESHIKAAVKIAQSGEEPPGKIHIYSDTRTQGLRLVVQKNKASWVVKYREWSKVVGYAWPEDERPLKTASAARDLVPIVKGLLDEDPVQLEPFLVARHNGRDNKAAIAEMRPVLTTWTIRECFAHFIEARTAASAKKPIGTNYIEELNRTLRRPELSKVVDEPAALLKRGQLENIRDDVEQSSGVSPSLKALSNVKNVLTYCCTQQSGKSGLDHRDMWWNLVTSDKQVKARDRKPDISDIAKTLVLAAEYLHKPLPGRQDGKRGVRPNVFSAFTWLVLTCQRANAGLSLLRSDFYADERDDGWYLAAWDEGVMKAKKTHVLPIPPRVAQHLFPLLEAAKNPDSKWAFASERGTSKKDIHVNRSAPLALVGRLAAKNAHIKGGKEAAVDLLTANGISYWTPHDIRRALTDVMDASGIPGGSSAVLAHEIKLSERLGLDVLSEAQRKEWQSQRVAKITSLAYGNPQHLDLKKRAMKAWSDAVLDALEVAQAPQAVELQAAA